MVTTNVLLGCILLMQLVSTTVAAQIGVDVQKIRTYSKSSMYDAYILTRWLKGNKE